MNNLQNGLQKLNTKNIKDMHLHKTSWAVNRFFGSLTSIFLTRSFALSDILGHGSDTKSSSPFKTCSNIPCSVSVHNIADLKIKLHC